ncbi:hypothetical protein [Lysobacter claricitrinus]|uniref:hypothetical protein n=1 Tax=Lysobacter claricitrinus TaxID=3367728 RepID=UPI0037DB718E
MGIRGTKHTGSASARPVRKALLVGGLIAAGTYGLALLCAVAQLNAAVVALAWPTFAITALLPPGEPVTYDLPSSPWLPLSTLFAAWAFYSAAWYIWHRYRNISAGA